MFIKNRFVILDINPILSLLPFQNQYPDLCLRLFQTLTYFDMLSSFMFLWIWWSHSCFIDWLVSIPGPITGNMESCGSWYLKGLIMYEISVVQRVTLTYSSNWHKSPVIVNAMYWIWMSEYLYVVVGRNPIGLFYVRDLLNLCWI